jgi:hypothetical protein
MAILDKLNSNPNLFIVLNIEFAQNKLYYQRYKKLCIISKIVGLFFS